MNELVNIQSRPSPVLYLHEAGKESVGTFPEAAQQNFTLQTGSLVTPPSYIELEDGSGHIALESGSGAILLE